MFTCYVDKKLNPGGKILFGYANVVACEHNF